MLHSRQTRIILGKSIPEPRVTARAWLLLFAMLVLPVFGLGTLADLLMQWLFGWCTGLWC